MPGAKRYQTHGNREICVVLGCAFKPFCHRFHRSRDQPYARGPVLLSFLTCTKRAPPNCPLSIRIAFVSNAPTSALSASSLRPPIASYSAMSQEHALALSIESDDELHTCRCMLIILNAVSHANLHPKRNRSAHMPAHAHSVEPRKCFTQYHQHTTTASQLCLAAQLRGQHCGDL